MPDGFYIQSIIKKEHHIKSIKNKSLNSNKLPKTFFKKVEELYQSDGLARDRKKILYQLTKILNKHFKIVSCGVKVVGSKRPTYNKNKENFYILSGLYVYNKRGMPLIILWNFSAIDGRKISNKNILENFLHEYIHHYDFKKLKIRTCHDSGFKKRLEHLRELAKLRE